MIVVKNHRQGETLIFENPRKAALFMLGRDLKDYTFYVSVPVTLAMKDLSSNTELERLLTAAAGNTI